MDGYVQRYDAVLTIAEFPAVHSRWAAARATPYAGKANAGVSTAEQNNNTSITINGTPIQDLLPTDNSWSSGTARACRSPRPARPTRMRPRRRTHRQPCRAHQQLRYAEGQQCARQKRERQVPFTNDEPGQHVVCASVEIQLASWLSRRRPRSRWASSLPLLRKTHNRRSERLVWVRRLRMPTATIRWRSPCRSRANTSLNFTGNVLRQLRRDPYDTGMTPEPTAQPMPTAEPVQEEGGMGILPIVIVVVLAVVAGAAIYGVYIYRRKSEKPRQRKPMRMRTRRTKSRQPSSSASSAAATLSRRRLFPRRSRRLRPVRFLPT